MSTPSSDDHRDAPSAGERPLPGPRFRAGVKLPPRKPKSELRLPPNAPAPELLPARHAKRFRCPYCGADIPAPLPKDLRCPSCGKTLRPPAGHRAANFDERRRKLDAIGVEHERALRAMGARVGTKALARAGMGAAILFLSIVGGLLAAASHKRADEVRKEKLDPYTYTTNALDTFAMALEHFRTDCGRYPYYEEAGLLALQEDMGTEGWCGPYIHGFRFGVDGWRTPYFYDCTNGVPVLYSAGPDRKFRTEDDLIVAPEQYRVHPEFVPHRERAGGDAERNTPVRVYPYTLELPAGL